MGKKKITETSNFTKKDLTELEVIYNSALADMGYTAESVSLIRGLAHLKGFFLGQPEKAIELLQTALGLLNADPTLLAECKLELGDIYIDIG